MAKVKLGQQLAVETANKMGMLAEVTGAVTGVGANIDALCAYGMDDKAYFMMLTSDNAKAQEALSKKGWPVKSEEVAIVELSNKVGAALEIANKIKQAGIDIAYLYGTTCGSESCPSALIISSNNNQALLKLLS